MAVALALEVAMKVLGVVGAGLTALLAVGALARTVGSGKRPVPRNDLRRSSSASAEQRSRAIEGILTSEGRSGTPQAVEPSKPSQRLERHSGAAPSDTIPAQEEFWDDLLASSEEPLSVDREGRRRKAMARTVQYLGLEGAQARAFESTSDRAMLLLRQAWELREASILASPSLDDAEAQTIQNRYEEAKRQALDPLLLELSDLPRHHRFRERFGEWVDAVR